MASSKKAQSKIAVIYIGVVFVIAVVLLLLVYLDDRYRNNAIEDLHLEYSVDEEAGDKLVTCSDGTYDVYRPRTYRANEFYFLCGSPLTSEVIRYIQALDSLESK